MYELAIETHFAAAHCLRGYQGECERLHGHNWRIRVVVASDRLDDLGMVMDFKAIKRILDEVIGAFDHRHLNELACFREQNPTTENVARIIAEETAARLPEGVHIQAVSAWESEGCSATYRPA